MPSVVVCQAVKVLRNEMRYSFSDCCGHVLVQYTNDENKVYTTVRDENEFAYSEIFTVFEREEGTTNERDHYKSLDGKYSIDYADCGAWSIKNYDERYEKYRNVILALFPMSVI